MSEYNIQFQDNDRSLQSLQLDPSFMDDDSRYPGPRRSRLSHASNPSWITNSFMHPGYGYPAQPPTPRGLSVPPPNLSRGMSASTSQWRGSEQQLEPTPESPTPEHTLDPEHAESEPEEEMHVEQEWVPTEASAEHMDNVPAHGDLEMGGGYEQPMGKGKSRGFVGGFVSGLRNLPRIITRNPLREHKDMKKEPRVLYNLDDPTEDLPRYEESGQPVAGPSNVQYVERMEMPSEQPASAQLSYASTNDEHLTNIPLHNPHSNEDVPPHHGLPSPAPVNSPVPVEPQPTADYVKMDSPVREAPPDDSISAHITRIRNFIQQLRDLPWMSSRTTIDYFPAVSPRARDPKVKSSSWYQHRQHQDVDLLATPGPVKAEVHHSDDGRSLTHRMRGPLAASHHSSSCPSQGTRRYAGSSVSCASPRSSHGGRRRSHFSYHSAQPAYLMSQPVSPNMQHVAGFIDPQTNKPVQLYMVHSGSPVLVPGLSPPPVSHPPTHIQFSTTGSPPPSNIGDMSLSR